MFSSPFRNSYIRRCSSVSDVETEALPSYSHALTPSQEHEIIVEPGIRSTAWIHSRRIIARSNMSDFNRKVEDASARVSKTIGNAAERLEKEIPEFIKYLNDEVVPAVRTHSTKALRVASKKLTEFADYMEQQQQHPPK